MKNLIIVLCLIFSCNLFGASPAPLRARNCMAVSAQHYATEVGYRILASGGNAVDAAVAMGYALAVVHPCCGNIGGGGFMLIRFANSKSTFINFREKAPNKIKPSLFLTAGGAVKQTYLSSGHIGGTLERPYLSVAIPGTVMGLNKALNRYGTLSLKTVITPAIKLAAEGYILAPGDVAIFEIGAAGFKKETNVGRIFLKNGRVYQAGDRLTQKNLADTLKEIAVKGNKGFYEGRIAGEIVKASRINGGVIEETDLKNYNINETRPLICKYHGYEVITAPPPGSGMTVCEALSILDRYPLSTLGFHAAIGSHYIIEAMRFAFFDRNRYLADPNFVKVPTNTILSPRNIENIRSKIKPNKATPNSIQFFTQGEGSNTTSYVVLDKQGTAVAVTYTINDYFGARIIPGNTGFFLNNELADFTISPHAANQYGLKQGMANLIAPNKRPASSMAPTILVKDNKPFMIISSPGGSTIPTQLINAIINVIDYGMNIQEAIDAPRFHMQFLPNKVFIERFAFSKDTAAILQKMGYQFQLGSPYSTPLWGAITAILIDTKTGSIYGAFDSRRSNGSAMGK